MKRAIQVFALVIIVAWLVWPASPKREPMPPSTKKALVRLTPSKRELPQATSAQDPIGSLNLSGQVVYPDGAPASGASVLLSTNPPREVLSDEHGWFFFEGLPARYFSIEAHKENLFGGPFSIDVDKSTEPIEIVLEEGATLEVMALQEKTSKPLSGINIALYPRYHEELSRVAKTDQDGVARFPGVSPSEATIELRTTEHRQGSIEIEINGTPNTTQREFIYALSGAAISGVVLNPSGAPQPGALVSLESIVPAEPTAQTTSNAKGEFTIIAPTGTYELTAKHPKYLYDYSGFFSILDNSPSASHVLHLRPSSSISGKVVDLQGQPIPYAMVRYSGQRASDCNDLGEFMVDGLSAGTWSLAVERNDQLGDIIKVTLSEQEERRDVVLVFDPGDELSGTVMTDLGEPIQDAIIRAQIPTPKPTSPGVFFAAPKTYQTTSDATGAFSFSGLPPGGYQLSAAPPSERFVVYQEVSNLKEMRFSPGDNNVPFMMKKTSRSSWVKGEVLFEGGGYPSSFLAEIYDGEQRVANSANFRVEVSGGREATLKISGSEFEGVEKILQIKPNEELDVGIIHVKRGRIIKGLVKDADGTPTAGAKITIEPQEADGTKESCPEYKTTTTKQDGTFIVQGVSPACALWIYAEHPQKGSGSAEEIAPGTSTGDVVISLSVGGEFSGKITQDGKPARASISFAPLGESFTERLQQGSSNYMGLFHLKNLEPGSYRVRFVLGEANFSGEPMLTKEITIQEGKITTLDVEFPVYPGADVTFSSSLFTSSSTDKGWRGSILFRAFRGKFNPARDPRPDEEYSYVPAKVSGETATAHFSDLVPGEYTFCVEITAPINEREYQDLPLKCAISVIKDSQENATITIRE